MCVCVCVCVWSDIHSNSLFNSAQRVCLRTLSIVQERARLLLGLGVTRDSFTSRLVCTNQSFFCCPSHTSISHTIALTFARLVRHLGSPPDLAFTRYCFTSTRLCTNQSSFHSSGPRALPTLLQYYCTTIGKYTTPPRPHPTPLLYTIHHPILVIRISCKGQPPTPFSYGIHRTILVMAISCKG